MLWMVFTVAKGLALPLLVAGGLAFGWSVKTSFETGAAAKAELALQSSYRAAEAAERERQEARHREARGKAVAAQEGLETELRRELDLRKSQLRALQGQAVGVCSLTDTIEESD